MNCWIGVAGGFAQMNHGKRAPLARMQAGDGLIYYSPREAYPDGPALQAFTALGFVRTGQVDAHDISAQGVPGFVPWRIDVDYQVVQSVPIKPLLAQLDFVADKTHWGVVFRSGQLKISTADFWKIAAAMACAPLHTPACPVQVPLF